MCLNFGVYSKTKVFSAREVHWAEKERERERVENIHKPLICEMAMNMNDANNIVNHMNNSVNANSVELNSIAPANTNGKKKRSYDFQNRKIRRRIWQEDEVHKLIIVWATRLDDLRQSKKNRHIYEEISDELNSMGLDTIREEVHIKIQNLSQLYR